MATAKTAQRRPNDDEVATAAEAGASVSRIVGQKKSNGSSDGDSDGDRVVPSLVGTPEGDTEGTSVGTGVIVGESEMVGVELGASEGRGDSVGPPEGESVGLDVTYRLQAIDADEMHLGVKASNCSTVSKTAAKGHRAPLLLRTKLRSWWKVLPKTTTSEEPTKLSRKQDFLTTTGPRDSMM